MITAGIDRGSRSIKIVLLEDIQVEGAPQIKYGLKKPYLMLPGDLDADQAATIAFDNACRVACATDSVTEMTAGAKGAVYLFPKVKTVVDVGAEEGRGIKADASGKATDFAGNEKCAAGAGSCPQVMCGAR